MTKSRINCPKCDARLALPAERLSPFIRCGVCGTLMHADCDLVQLDGSSTKSDLATEKANDAGPMNSRDAPTEEVKWISEPHLNSEPPRTSSQNGSNPYFHNSRAGAGGSEFDEPIYLGPETGSELLVSQNTRQRTAGSGLRVLLVTLLIGMPIGLVVLNYFSYSRSIGNAVRGIEPSESTYDLSYTTADMLGTNRLVSTVTLSQWKDKMIYPKLEIDLSETLENNPFRRDFPDEVDSIELSGSTWSESRYFAIANAPLLKKLHYSHGVITQRLITAIRNTSLFELYLEDCRWERNRPTRFTHPAFRQLYKLSLAGTPVTQLAVKDLTVCYGLEELYLQRTNVGDFAIESINDFVGLKKLDLSDTKVTLAGLRGLHSQTLEKLWITARELTPSQRNLLKRNNPNLKSIVVKSPKEA